MQSDLLSRPTKATTATTATTTTTTTTKLNDGQQSSFALSLIKLTLSLHSGLSDCVSCFSCPSRRASRAHREGQTTHSKIMQMTNKQTNRQTLRLTCRLPDTFSSSRSHGQFKFIINTQWSSSTSSSSSSLEPVAVVVVVLYLLLFVDFNHLTLVTPTGLPVSASASSPFKCN